MPRTFTVQTTINRPAADVFQAIVEPEALTRYFADITSARMKPGERVVWHWEEWGDYPVQIDEVTPNERISLRLNVVDWKKTKGEPYDVTVVFELEGLGPAKTLLRISESGWRDDPDGIRGSYENCGGWQHMACCLKAYLEYDIDLR